MAIKAQPLHGTAVRNTNNTITYTPNPSFEGDVDSFTYNSSNSGGTSWATVLVRVVPDIKVFHLQDLNFGTIGNQVQTPMLSLHAPLIPGANGQPAFNQPGFDVAAGVISRHQGITTLSADIVLGGVGKVFYYDAASLLLGGASFTAGFSPYTYPSGSLFDGEVRVAVADMNNDGYADIVTGNGAGITNEVRIFSGFALQNSFPRDSAGRPLPPLGVAVDADSILISHFVVNPGPLDDGMHGIRVAALGPLLF